MDQEAAFLAEIAANPDDNGTRQVYADWLEEQGDPRAELIRLQCGSQTPSVADSVRISELLQTWRSAWLEPIRSALPPEVERTIVDYRFNRGLANEITVGAEDYVTHGAVLAERAPLVDHLGLKIDVFRLENLSHMELSRLRTLSISGRVLLQQPLRAVAAALERCPLLRGLELRESGPNTFDAAGFAQLCDTPQFQGLRRLVLRLSPAENQLARLADCPLSELTHLDLQGCVLGVRGADALASAGQLERLAELDLARTRIDAVGVEILADAPQIRQVRRLNLADLNLRNEVAEMFGARSWPNLEHLDLSGNELGEKGIRHLAVPLARLRSVNLSSNALGDDGVAALAELDCSQVEQLHLANCGIEKGLAALAKSKRMGLVRDLSLLGNRVAAASVQKLLESPAFRQLAMLRIGGAWGHFGPSSAQAVARAMDGLALRQLQIEHPRDGDDCVKNLVRSAGFKSVYSLTLINAKIGFSGAEALANCPDLQNLRRLCLWGNRIDDDGLDELCRSPHLQGLTALELGGNSIGTRGMQSLLRSLVLPNLTRLSLDRNRIAEQGLLELADLAVLPALMHLKLDAATVGNNLRSALRQRFGARLTLV